MRLHLPFYRDLSTSQQVRLHGAWGCSHQFLTNLYPISEPIPLQEVANYLSLGLSESVYSANSDAVSFRHLNLPFTLSLSLSLSLPGEDDH
jgi:hypothetical protein